MKKQVKKKQGILMLGVCLLAGAFCACNQGRETNTTVTPAEVSITPFPTSEATATELPENTKVPSVTKGAENSPTEVPTEEPVLTPTPEPLDELIPIDEAHFTSEVFRMFLTVKYDTNQDGFLSRSEREAVKEIEWGRDELAGEVDINQYTILDGFEYFSYLEHLAVIEASVDEVIFKNHPSIRRIGGGEGGIGKLSIENCPALESIGGGMYWGHIWSVSNCENLKRFAAAETNFGSLSFSGCPQLVLDFEKWNNVGNLLLNADAVLTALSDGLCTIRKDGYLDLPGITFETIEWENVAEQAIEMPEGEDFFFKYFDKHDFAYMGVQVFEKIEDIYDEQGRKGWNICIDRKIDAYSKTAFSLYTEVPPEPEQIFVRPARVKKAVILEYSPNQGVSFHIIWELEVVYAGAAGESVLGTMFLEDQYWTITPDGTKTAYKSEKEWQKNGSRYYQMYEQLYKGEE